MQPAGGDREPDLGRAERDCRRRAHSGARHLAGGRVHAGRDVDRDHRPAGSVDQLDHACRVLARRAREPDAEQRVDDHIGRAEVADALDDRHLAARLAQHTGANLAVAAVVALPADDVDAAGVGARSSPE